MFKFFVLSISGSGEARRHFPFRSIIHKHVLPFFFVLVVLLFSSVPVHVSAMAAPELNPVYNTDIIQIQEYVNGLSSGQMDVFNILLGFYLASQAGSAYYQLDNPYESQDGVLNWLKSCGVKFYNDFGGWFPVAPEVTGFDNGKLLSVILGAAILADQYSGQSDFVSDVQNSTHYFLPFDQSLQIGLNQFFASNGGLYNWQISDLTIGEVQNKSWNISGASEQDISDVLSHVGSNGIRFNYNHTSGYDITTVFGTVSSVNLRDFHILFIDTDDHTIKLVNDSGQAYSGYNSFQKFGLLFRNSMYYDVGGFGTYLDSLTVNYEYSSSLISPVQIVTAYFEHVNNISNGYYPLMNDFVNVLYAGIDWNGRQLISLSDDLNFSQSTSVSYDQVQSDLLLDIKGLLLDLLDTNDLRAPVFNNFYDTSGSSVSDPATVSVSVNAILPDSGIDIPSNIFGGFFNSNDGFISYLWYMTKPLVVYTHDLLDCFWFGPVDGFDWSGPAPIVFGVISLGLIGGLIVKMLL